MVLSILFFFFFPPIFWQCKVTCRILVPQQEIEPSPSSSGSLMSFFFFLNFIHLISDVLGLHCHTQAFSSCSKLGLPSSCSAQTSHCSSFPCAEHGLQACRLSSHSTRALLLHGMWNLPRPGIEPVSPALAGGFLTTGPPGKSLMS